jgi:murein DD-endopeptidase MepM/ murein hydrolase activator NlpD
MNNSYLHFRKLFFLLFMISTVVSGYSVAQDVKFIMPLKGTEGRDYFTINYVDHGSWLRIRDPFCGTQTYRGHTGTDFCLRSFKAMDSGVYVYAAANGRVFHVTDGKYDRSKHWRGGGYGNHVTIVHKNDMRTIYGHLMKNSILVKAGDSVRAGQPIGKVGSSGKSKCPHLHFGVRGEKIGRKRKIIDLGLLKVAAGDKQKRRIIDPFSGNCQTKTPSLWLSQPLPDTSVYAIDAGFVPYRPGKDTLQERYLVNDTFFVNKNNSVCLWVLMHGLFKRDRITVEWYTPDNNLWLKDHGKMKFNSWYCYSWSYKHLPWIQGKWLAKYYINRRLILSRNFYML